MIRIGLSLAGWLTFAAISAQALGPTPEPRKQLLEIKQTLRNEQKDLQNIKRKAIQEKATIVQGRKRERLLLHDLQHLEQRIEEAEDRYAEDQQNLALLQQNLYSIQGAISQNEGSLDEMKKLLAQRLRALYRENTRGPWLTLLSSQSFSEAAVRFKFFHILSAQNMFWIEQLSHKRRLLSDQRRELARRENQARELKIATLKMLEQIRRKKAERETLLREVRDDQRLHKQMLEELTTAAQQLSALLEKLRHKTAQLEQQLESSGATFAQRAGRLPWPTRGRVVTRFGRVKHPRFNTYLLNKGIDIAGSIRQNVVSVAPGNVLFAQWFEGYGRMIILDHGHGYNTVYAHLDKILTSEGQNVSEVQVIGTLGDSGTWKGPALYFEIRKRGEAQNPLLWLSR